MAKKKRALRGPRILMAWIGATDLKAAGIIEDDDPRRTGIGPIAHALSERAFDRVAFLDNYGEEKATAYLEWLGSYTEAELEVTEFPGLRPTDHKAIHEAVDAHVGAILERYPDAELTYHLSPGTPAMHAVWLTLAQTIRPARLIASTIQHGVEEVELPFRLTFEVISEAYRGADDALSAALSSAPHIEAAFESIIRKSQVMEEVIRMAKRVALTDIPTLILGESGTGKEMLASAIHGASRRRDKPFRAVNCGAIPEELLESELFGHERGAFTGAFAAREGLFREAEGGTVFLDEVGELPPKAQVRLLRAIQERCVRPVGGAEEIPVDVRIIAATHRPLKEMVARGQYREDLYFRLAVAILRLPAMRDRRADIGPLVDFMMVRVREKLAHQPGPIPLKLSPEAMRRLRSHPWPGNVRELENVLTQAGLWARSETLHADEIVRALEETPHRPSDIFDQPLGGDFKVQTLLDQLAGYYIRRALDETDWNKAKAARLLGLRNATTLTRWMERCGVSER